MEENTGHVHRGLFGELVILLELQPSHVEARVEAWTTESHVSSLREVMMEEIHVGKNFIQCILPTLAYRDLLEYQQEGMNTSEFVPVVVDQCVFLDLGMIFSNPILEFCSPLHSHVNQAKP